MLKNYFIIALRNLAKHKGYSMVNIFGLATGLACCILIAVFVQDELSYDRFHDNAERIYRVTREFMNKDGSTSLHLGHVAPQVGPLLKNDFPEVQQAVRINGPREESFSVDENMFVEDLVFFAEHDFFNLFSFDLIAGDQATALSEPFTVVLSRSAARRLFGDADPMGSTISLPDQAPIDLKVTGIIEDAPQNSHFHYNVLISFVTFEALAGPQALENWGSNNYATYLLFDDARAAAAIQARLPDFLTRHLSENAPKWTKLQLQPLLDIHLYSHLDSELEQNGDIAYVIIFSVIGLFILIIACINFMNLSTARSARRAREVGIRKVAGARRAQLVGQFLGESLTITAIASICALAMVITALPILADFVGRDYNLENLAMPSNLLLLIGLILTVGLLAGFYPALFLSAFKPVSVLKAQRSFSTSGSLLRRALVVFQFAISVFLITGLGVVMRQLDYCHTKNLGFDRERVVVLPVDQAMQQNFAALKRRWIQHPGIASVAASSRTPAGRLLDSWGARTLDTDDPQAGWADTRVAFVSVDHDFVETYGIDIVAGRDFSPEFPTDTSKAFVINQAAVHALGWNSPTEAVGSFLQYGPRKGRVVGVMNDFHFESMREKIAPLVLMIGPKAMYAASLRLRADDMQATLAYLESEWKTLRPEYPFSYTFIDDDIRQLYLTEERLISIVGVFTALAILIACLGLLSLASFTTEQRLKEIGIRKVLGAGVGNIVALLSGEFVKLTFIASGIAWIGAYAAMDRWLATFAYSVGLDPWIFIAAGATAVGIALATVSLQTVKAALSNPANVLRSD